MVLKRADLPNQLPVLRAARRVKQTEVAASAGISPNRYWRIENGVTEPTDDERITLARVLGASQSEIWPNRVPEVRHAS
jgi:transcriptional regulator with XRE-family HTH domain